MYLPRYDPKKEYESTLSEARIQAGMFVTELCEKVKITPGYYSSINSGVVAPITRDGAVRECVIRIAELLGVNLSDLFPRYFCPIRKFDISDEEILKTFHQGLFSEEYSNPEDILIAKERREILEDIINSFGNINTIITFMRIINEIELNEVGKYIGISRERVRQKEIELKLKLKKRMLLDERFINAFLDIEPQEIQR